MKIIGISSSTTENRLFTNHAYSRALTRPGVVPVMLPLFPAFNRETLTQGEYNAHHKDHIDGLVDRLDCYVASGGPDINPVLFDEAIWGAVGCDAERDMMELALIDGFVKAGKPILGICKGHQLAGLYFGLGNFVQDLGDIGEVHSTSDRDMKDRMEPAHTVQTFGAFRTYLREVTGRHDLTSIKTNSHHHQSFCLTPSGLISKADMKDLGTWYPKARLAYEQAYGVNILAATLKVIEAIEKPEARFVGLQFHGEEAGPTGPSIQYFLDRYVLNV